MQDPTLIIKDTPEKHVVRLTINRPDKRNALSTPILSALVQLVSSADGDPDIRAIIITGGEKIFAAGADINEMATRTMPQTYVEPRRPCGHSSGVPAHR